MHFSAHFPPLAPQVMPPTAAYRGIDRMRTQNCESTEASGGDTFIHAYDACLPYFQHLLKAKNKCEINERHESKRVPRVGHRYQARGGSTGDRTAQSIAHSPGSARTGRFGLPGGEIHA